MRKERPELKQLWDISVADFERHPVWIGVHGTADSEWWYEETDEGTYQPWTGSLPVAPDGRDLRVRAIMELPNGTCYEGYISPVPLDWDTPQEPQLAALTRIGGKDALIAHQQPSIFIGNKGFSFWGGMRGIPLRERQAFYSSVGLRAEKVFPLRFAAKPGLVSGIVDGTVFGFYKLVKKDGNLVGEIENDQALDLNVACVDSAATALSPVSQERGGSERCNDAVLSPSHLTADPPPVDRSPTSRYYVYLTTALPEKIRQVECDPSNRRLYVDVSFIQLQLQDYERCLVYSDAGLSAVDGSKGKMDMHEELTYLGARALFGLGRYQEALDRLTQLWPRYTYGSQNDPLWSKSGLTKACKAALRVQRKMFKTKT